MIRIKRATDNDMETIFMMGYDAWGDNMPNEEYVAMCQDSDKYKVGNWYVLEEDETKELLSSLIVYDLNSPESLLVKGIGSIATPVHFRNNGYASLLIKETIKELEQKENCSHFFLYSDIGTEFYKRLDFIVLPTERQQYKHSVCMYYSKGNAIDLTLIDTPKYF